MNRTLSIFFAFCILACSSCKIEYGFSPVPRNDVPDDPALVAAYEKATISVDFFQSYASLAAPTLSQTFTESLRDIFLSQSKYRMIDRNGDIRVQGSITGYDVKPVAIQSNETAANNRLTITVNVKYTNTIEDEKSFEQSFSRFADFDANQSLSSVEDALIEEINEQLVQDIFNRTLGDW